MDEYIKRESVLKAIESVFAWNRSFGDLFDEVRDIPSEDVAPVRHGVWRYAQTSFGIDEFNCSLCGQLMTTAIGKRMTYCPNCGCRMDGGVTTDT